ncbi:MULTISPECIES: PKD domain-containing protein [unclassified Carboxylicivirga]|uniref:PKD domain-containing protein n=1 Tax=Carboxylicivirga TaxID=1628153 RepID=UPI003D33AB35
MDGKIKAVLIVFGILFSFFPGKAQECNVNVLTRGGDFTPLNLCAPVTIEWEPFYTLAEDIQGRQVEFLFDWDDGSVEYVTASLIDAAAKKWAIPLITHTYDSDKCHYKPALYIVVDGIVCENSLRSETVIVWDTDDRNGGTISINPKVFPICIGNSGSVTFMDESEWNCVPPVEDDSPNNYKRWIQWIYGTNNGSANFINNAEVNGAVRSYPYAGSIDVTTEPILGPSTPWNEALPIYVPAGHAVGDAFEITLNNWNYCNPYDQGFPPVSSTAIVLIVDNPDGSINPSGPLCENDNPINLSAVTPGGQWSGPGITDEWNGTFDPSLAGPGTHTINYYVEDGNSCSATGSTTITVLDSPLATLSTGNEAHLCPGTQLQITANNTQGTAPYTHLWTGDTAPLSETNIHNPEFLSINEGTYMLTYRVTDALGCFDEQTISIGVDSVNISFTNQHLSLCSGITQSLEPKPTGGSGTFVYHEWRGDRLDLLSATNIENPVFNSTTPGKYKYLYIVRDEYGCEDMDSIFVEVHEQPASQAGPNATACGLSYTLKAVPYVGNGQWHVSTGAGSVSFSDINAPNATVSVDQYGDYSFIWTENNNGCVDADEVTITFVEIPHPKVMAPRDTCGLEHKLRATHDIGIGQWQLVNGPGLAIINDDLTPTTTVSVDTPGDYTFEWTEDNVGCLGSADVTLTFYPLPKLQLQAFDNEQCGPSEITFINNSKDADQYLWDFGDGYISNQKNPSHIFVNTTVEPIDYTIQLSASNSYGCADTSEYNIRVLPTPVAKFDNEDEPACSPLSIDFNNQSEGATHYQWLFGDGNKDSTEHVSHTFVNAEHYVQSFNVSLVASNTYGCRDTINKYITVYPTVSYAFDATPLEGCHPLQVDMVAQPGAYTYQWVFGDGQSLDGANIASHIFHNKNEAPQEFTIKLHTSSVFGCRDSSEAKVRVLPSPTSHFELSDNEGCSPFDVAFTNLSSGGNSSIWSFGDGTSTETGGTGNASHRFVNSELAPITYQPQLVVKNSYGCSDSSRHHLNVFPKVTASISDGGAGCTPYSESFLNNSMGANQFTWDFGDGNISNSFNGHNTYTNSSFDDINYRVELIAESPYGCSDTAHTNVLVYRRPVPEFSLTPQELQMPESTITITNQTQGSNWQYKWQFGDNETSNAQHPGTHSYGASGDYEVWLKASGEHCADSLMQTVLIYPTLPALDYGPNAEGCPSLDVQFYNNTVDAHTYFWDFGDGNVSSEKAPLHSYHTPGKYRVKLIAEGPGGMVEADHVEVWVYDRPLANFEVRPTLVKLPETVSFINKSEGAVSYLWDFGDGQRSNDHSVQYLYEHPGIYDVSLQATSNKGCTAEYIMREAVIAEEAGSILFPNAFTPNPSGPSGGHYQAGSSDNYVFYPFVHEGLVEYELRIYTRWGELIFESHDINIGWDGYYRDKICPGGVYIWKVNCRFSNGNMEVKTGDVTLFR